MKLFEKLFDDWKLVYYISCESITQENIIFYYYFSEKRNLVKMECSKETYEDSVCYLDALDLLCNMNMITLKNSDIRDKIDDVGERFELGLVGTEQKLLPPIEDQPDDTPVFVHLPFRLEDGRVNNVEALIKEILIEKDEKLKNTLERLLETQVKVDFPDLEVFNFEGDNVARTSAGTCISLYYNKFKELKNKGWL